MPNLKEFKCIVEDSINDTVEHRFLKFSQDRDFIVDNIKSMYDEVTDIMKKFSDFYEQTLNKHGANVPVDVLSFVAEMRADSYKNSMHREELKYAAMTRIYEALPADLSAQTRKSITSAKQHAEYQALTDHRMNQAVKMLEGIKSNNLVAEVQLHKCFIAAMRLTANHSDYYVESSHLSDAARDYDLAADLIAKNIPGINQSANKSISMEKFIQDRDAANNPVIHKLNVPAMKQVCSFVPTMKAIDEFVRDNPSYDKTQILLMKKALLAVNGRDVKSVVSGLVTAKINIYKYIDSLGQGENATKEMKDKVSLLYRTVLRDVDGAFRLGYALVVPAKNTPSQSPSLSVA